MSSEKFDFGALVDDQMKGIRRGYKFGSAFNEDKQIVRPAKKPVVTEPDDNIAVKEAWENGAAISGVVEKEIKGGYEVTVAGERAFCPYSQIDRFGKDASEYVGRRFDFLVSEYSRDDRGPSIVVSRRALLEVEAEALKEAVLERLVEGETINGTVTRVMNFGAFVDLGGVEGLVPVREIAWERIEDPKKILKPGDGITVKVLHINRDEARITLSRRECMERVFRKSAEEEAAEENAAQVAEWMAAAKKKNAAFGRGAFDSL